MHVHYIRKFFFYGTLKKKKKVFISDLLIIDYLNTEYMHTSEYMKISVLVLNTDTNPDTKMSKLLSINASAMPWLCHVSTLTDSELHALRFPAALAAAKHGC